MYLSSCRPLTWLVCISAIAGHYIEDRDQNLISMNMPPALEEEPEMEAAFPNGRALDSSMSSDLFGESGLQDRGLFAAFEGSSKHGKYRGGGMFYGGRTPILGDYGIGDPSRFGNYYGRPFDFGFNGNRKYKYGGQIRPGYGRDRDRYPGRGFYRQPYASAY